MKKLVKSRSNRMICGVCGGLADYLKVDATVIRIALVLLAFTATGIIAYIVAAIIMPDEYDA